LSTTWSDDELDWRGKAACIGHTSLFYAQGVENEVTRRRRENVAREICKNCPVIAECRAYVDATYDMFAFAANENPRQRATRWTKERRKIPVNVG
jgi:WhiB family transcriptional regulator, redox-sensing transcriptional regulator